MLDFRWFRFFSSRPILSIFVPILYRTAPQLFIPLDKSKNSFDSFSIPLNLTRSSDRTTAFILTNFLTRLLAKIGKCIYRSISESTLYSRSLSTPLNEFFFIGMMQYAPCRIFAKKLFSDGVYFDFQPNYILKSVLGWVAFEKNYNTSQVNNGN